MKIKLVQNPKSSLRNVEQEKLKKLPNKKLPLPVKKMSQVQKKMNQVHMNLNLVKMNNQKWKLKSLHQAHFLLRHQGSLNQLRKNLKKLVKQ